MLDALYAAFFQAAAGPPGNTPAAAPTEQSAAPPAQAPAQPAAPVRHCRYMTPTGSHIPVRVCATDEEVAELAERTRDEILHRSDPGLSPEQIQAMSKSH